MKNSLYLFITALVIIGAAFAEDFTSQETITVTVSPNDRLEIYNINGDITLEEWDSSELELTYVKTAEDAETLEHLIVEIDEERGLECNVEYDDEWNDFENTSVDFIVYIPSGRDLDIETAFVNGDIKLVGGSGVAEIELVNGSIDISGFSGPLEAYLVNGEMTLAGVPALETAEIVNGTITCELSSVGNDLDLSSVSGDIIVKLRNGACVVIETISGEIEIADIFGATVSENYIGRSSEFGSGEYELEINTVSGNIQVTD